MGKTALALKMAINIAQKSERRIAFFSLEMGHKQLGRRVMSMLSGVPSDAIKRKGSATEHYRMICDGCELMYALPISVNEQSGISIPRMRADLRRLKRDRPLGCVIVDYLQLMSGSGRRNENRTQEVGEIAKGLKEIAKEFDVPVIALAQLNRGVETRQGNRPRISDLRESGDIEAAADLVLLLYRENYYKSSDEQDTNPDRIEKAELIVDKHRNGPTGIVTLGFQPKLASFENVRL
jgi:replicative DNA helicase